MKPPSGPKKNKTSQSLCGGDWCLVVPLVFKASVGLKRSRVDSIPIRLRHLIQKTEVKSLAPVVGGV